MQDKCECYGRPSRRDMRVDPWWCIELVNMWTRVRYPTSKKELVVVVQVSQESKLACCNQTPQSFH